MLTIFRAICGRRSWRMPELTIRTRPAGSSPGPPGSDRPERFIAMVNAERSPTFYGFDSLEQLRVWRDMDGRDEEPVVIYHSHTATEAYPSRTDISYAMPSRTPIMYWFRREIPTRASSAPTGSWTPCDRGSGRRRPRNDPGAG